MNKEDNKRRGSESIRTKKKEPTWLKYKIGRRRTRFLPSLQPCRSSKLSKRFPRSRARGQFLLNDTGLVLCPPLNLCTSITRESSRFISRVEIYAWKQKKKKKRKELFVHKCKYTWAVSIDERCAGLVFALVSTAQICTCAWNAWVNWSRVGSERERERERERCPGLLLVGVVPDLTEGVHSIFYGGQPPRSGMLLAGYTHWR